MTQTVDSNKSLPQLWQWLVGINSLCAFYPLLVQGGEAPPVELECKMHTDCWIQQVTTKICAVTCWIQQSVSPKQVVGFTCVFNSEIDKLISKVMRFRTIFGRFRMFSDAFGRFRTAFGWLSDAFGRLSDGRRRPAGSPNVIFFWGNGLSLILYEANSVLIHPVVARQSSFTPSFEVAETWGEVYLEQNLTRKLILRSIWP